MKINFVLHNLQKTTFYLLLLLLPTQFGKHFWPNFSYIQGIRIDYLSPTLYVTDVLIIILLVLFVFNNCNNFIKKIKNQSFDKAQDKKSKIKTNHLSLRDHEMAKQSRFKGDCFVALLLAMTFKKFIRIWIFILLLLFLLIGILLSKNPFAGTYGLIKIFEFAFFGYYVSQKIRSIKDLKLISLIFSIGILFESLLSIAQYFNQGSIGGIFYFFGERAFNSQTPGIANASLNGELVLRPYGTFSHPNVLAAYLTIALAIVISNFKYPISNFKKSFFGFAILVGTISLLLTMSRVAILLWMFIIVLMSIYKLRAYLKALSLPLFSSSRATRGARRPFEEGSALVVQSSLWKDCFVLLTRNDGMRKFFILLIVMTVIIISILSPIRYRFISFNFNDESLIARKDLIITSLQMIKDNPLLGVGVNNFLVNIPYYQKFNSMSLFSYFQPVHNIYLLVWAELGIVGFATFVLFIFRTIIKIKNSCEAGSRFARQKSKIKNKFTIYNLQFTILILVLVLGLFDHYFLTLQQGQLLFAFVLGVCWSKIKIDEGKNKRDNRI